MKGISSTRPGPFDLLEAAQREDHGALVFAQDPAIARLTGLITALPDEPSSHRDHESIAARLVALLPHGAGSGGPKSALPGGDTAFDPHAVLRVIVINVLFVAFMVGAQWFAASHQAPAPVSDNLASAAHATAPAPPSPKSWQ
jgi:hypothetical protein